MRTGSAAWLMHATRSRSGSKTTTNFGRTAACNTLPRWSLLSSRQASTWMKWGKRPQTPAPSPTPPSPLRTEAIGANRNRRKSHYPWTKDGGQVMDVHKKTISYCVKDARGQVLQDGKI